MAGFAEIVDFVVRYLTNMPQEILSGDIFAVSLFLMAVYLMVYIVNKLTGLIIFFLKGLFLLTIVTLAYSKFIRMLIERVYADGWTHQNVILGVSGLIIGLAAFSLSAYAALSSLKDVHKDIREETKSKEIVEKPDEDMDEVMEKKKVEEQMSLNDMFKLTNLRNDKTLGVVLTYLIIAQFGVFSSKTISAPNETIGLYFFILFISAALLFIRQSYSDYVRGLRHFIVALLMGTTLSIVLGHYWGGYPRDIMLSLKYFGTDSLVALVTSLSVSLFMSSK